MDKSTERKLTWKGRIGVQFGHVHFEVPIKKSWIQVKSSEERSGLEMKI